MGEITKKVKNEAKKKVKNVIKVKLVAIGVALSTKIIPILLAVVTISALFDFVTELFRAENIPEEIYNQLGIENVSELIQIKGNKQDGYYLDFIDGIDDKLGNVIQTINNSGEFQNVTADKKFLKKLLKAEAVTKYPNLGGKIPEGSDGFQGAIDIKRATPNKGIGEMVNTGKDNTNMLEPETSYNDSQITPKEEQIKKWEEGKELILYNDSVIYEKVKGKWIEKKYEDSDKVVKIKKSSKTKYTGKYEVSEDKLNNSTIIYVEVTGKNTKKEDVKGYIRSSQINLRSTDEEIEDIKEVLEWDTGKELFLNKDEVDAYTKAAGVWTTKIKEGTLSQLKIKKSDKITYAGKYEKYENDVLSIPIIYVYVNIGEAENKTSEYIKFSDIDIGKSKENKKETTSRARENNARQSEKITVGGEKEGYVVAIAAGHNNTDDKGAISGDLKEEELSIKVAEKVEQLVEERYKNVEVVQTGSTSSNPGGIKVEERTTLARNANPDLCIQIHFNAAGSPDANGVEVIYKDQDGISQQLAEILSRTISQEMGLTDRKAGTDLEKCAVGSLGIIENAADTHFPSVVTEGGFLTGYIDSEVIRNGGTDKYAEGITKGIKEYLEADHTGYTSHSTGEMTETASVQSKVLKLKYLQPGEFEELKTSNVEEAKKYFTLNAENKLVTLSWKKNEDESIEIKENAAVDFRTSLQKYHMPYEYLLHYYIDTDYKAFSEKLADIVLESEIVITLQDNVTTTHTVIQKEKLIDTEGEAPVDVATNGWQDAGTEKDSTTEFVRTTADITYIETWCVKVYQDNSFSKKVLNMGNQEEIIANAPGTVNENKGDKTYGNTVQTVNERRHSGNYTEEGNAIYYTHIEYERTATTVDTISNSYDTGGDMKVEGTENKYVDLYVKEKMNKKIKEDWLFLILEKNERIKQANLVDLTKYLMFLASRTDYGVTEFDFEDEFSLKKFSQAGGIYGNSPQEKVWFAVLGAGYSKDAAAGVLGNIEAESGFDPNIIEGGTGIGFGLCQWSYGRRTQIEQYAASKGKEPGDLNTQIEFLIAEITPGGGADGFANYQLVEYNGYSPSDWENASTPEDAAIAFCWSFERPGIPRMEIRTEAARRYYEEFKDKEKPTGGGNVLETCVQVMNDMINRNVHYSTSNLTWGDIEAASTHPYACCATYVSVVLYKSGILTADQMNAYNYNYTGSGGLPDMLSAAGWTEVSHSEIQPGDVINEVGVHALIYAGGNMVYDQNCGVVSSYGNPPIGGPYDGWSYYNGKANVQVWRAP